MKVICVDIDNIKPCNCGSTISGLVEENAYSVEQDEGDANSFDVKGLERCVKCGCLVSYSKHRFIPLSTIDEMELLEQRQEQLV